MITFLRIFWRIFPPLSEDFPKLFRRKDRCFQTFFKHFLKISEEGPIMFWLYSNTPKYFLMDYVTIAAMVVILVTLATPISSHVKDKNSIFTSCDEDMIFSKGKILVFKRCLSSNTCLCTWIWILSLSVQLYLRSEHRKQVRYRVEHEKIKFISTSGHVIFCLLYKHQWNTKPFHLNHNDSDLFMCEDNMLFLCVRICSFRAKAHLVFHWCLYNKFILYMYLLVTFEDK